MNWKTAPFLPVLSLPQLASSLSLALHLQRPMIQQLIQRGEHGALPAVPSRLAADVIIVPYAPS